MFKLICDLTKEYYGSENETAITVLRYSDCNPCGAVGYNLTSSSAFSVYSGGSKMEYERFKSL